MQNAISMMGRILLAVGCGMFAIAHLTAAQQMAGMVPAALSSVAVPIVYVTGICLTAAAISFLIGKWMRWAGILLAVFLIIIILMVHLPNAMSSDQNTMMMGVSMLQKDLMIAGGALFVAGKAKD